MTTIRKEQNNTIIDCCGNVFTLTDFAQGFCSLHHVISHQWDCLFNSRFARDLLLFCLTFLVCYFRQESTYIKISSGNPLYIHAVQGGNLVYLYAKYMTVNEPLIISFLFSHDLSSKLSSLKMSLRYRNSERQIREQSLNG